MIINRFTIVIVIMLWSSQAPAADELKPRLLKCAVSENTEQRLRCYDDLSEELNLLSERTDNELLETPEASASSDSLVEEPDESVLNIEDSLPSDLGGEQFKEEAARSKQQSQVLATGRVNSCKRAADGKWFFIFENGQVWKQVGSRRRNYRDCDFLVKIKKDGIGFKMQISGETSVLRIKRAR